MRFCKIRGFLLNKNAYPAMMAAMLHIIHSGELAPIIATEWWRCKPVSMKALPTTWNTNTILQICCIFLYIDYYFHI